MDFQKLLLDIDNNLGNEELKASVFLCTDLLHRNPNSVESFTDLFLSLMSKDVLSAEEPQFLTELLTTIQQHRLLRSLQLSDQVTSNYISSYRKLLYNLSEDITDQDLQHMKFLLNQLLPRRKLADNSSTLDVFLEMEHSDLINETNLDKLEEIFKTVCPVLNKKIDQYKASPIQETSRPRSLSLTTETNQIFTPFMRSGSFGRPVQQHFLPLTPSPMNSFNSSDDVGQVGVRCEPQLQNIASSELKQTGPETTSSVAKESEDTKTSFETLKTYVGLDTYPMTAGKRGVCVILNNNDFSKSSVYLRERVGTSYDEESLEKVFAWLGFEVKIHRDLDRNKMISVVKKLSKEDHSQMDCLVCCVLSHGMEGNVYGVDGCSISIKELMRHFDGLECRSLVEKPKLFFIQACQGNKEQKPVEADGGDEDISSDAQATESIPNGADFLLGMATVPNYVSFRDRNSGTWYIQSLCQNLIQMVPSGADLISILTKVNADVSKKSDLLGRRKQMPQPAFSLRKRVIFPVPKMPPPVI